MSELGELYVSMTLKSLALSLVAVFIPVFLYQEGYSVESIAMFYAFYFTLRIAFDLLAGYLTALVGPKHMLAYSYILLIVFLGLLITLPEYGWPLFAIAIVKALYNSFFFIAYHVDFSKVHSVARGGAELSLMNILVRAAAAAGPFVGGLVATLVAIEATIGLALILVLIAIWPLMMSEEPIKKQRGMDLSSFSLRQNLANVTSYSALGVSRQIGLAVWPLYISIFIFTDDIYAKVGLVTSISIGVSLLVARLYGKIIDKDAGRTLLNASSVMSSLTHFFRPSINTLGGVSLINMVSELADTGVILPFTKGLYDEADYAKDRIAYIAMMEAFLAAVRAVFWLMLAWAIMAFNEQQALTASFSVAAAASLLVAIQRFGALRGVKNE